MPKTRFARGLRDEFVDALTNGHLAPILEAVHAVRAFLLERL